MKPTLRTVAQSGPEPNAPPADLSPSAAEHFRRLRDDYGIADSFGIFILSEALRSWDRAESARRIIQTHGELLGSGTRLRKNPAAAIEQTARAACLKALRSLGCETEPVAAPGRPRGR